MQSRNRCAKINLTVLVIVVVAIVALGISLVAARQVRRNILSKISLEAGTEAFEQEDWVRASREFQEYLGRNPDDVEILRKYAQARLAIRPLEPANVIQAIAAYRRVVQLDPGDEDTHKELASLYTGIGNFDELAYVARTRLAREPNDLDAPLWLAEALVRMNRADEAQQVLREFIGRLDALEDKRDEYVKACIGLSNIASAETSREAKTEVLKWLNQAVNYAPQSAEALVHRGRFYRVTSEIPGVSEADRPALARKDLEAAGALDIEDPKIRYALGAEWLVLGEVDRAAEHLQAMGDFDLETLEDHFLNVNDWKVARFLFASELVTREGKTMEAASLVDEALAELTERRHRVLVLRSAVPLYVAAGRIAEARTCLDEYLDAMQLPGTPAESPVRLASLRALVASAEGRSYAVINAVQPVVASNPHPNLWRLLAEAYIRTEQARRAVDALGRYLHHYPQDAQMTLELAKQYSRLGDQERAFEAAQTAESLSPADVAAKLFRIGTGIHLATRRPGSEDAATLRALAAELTDLRREHPGRVDVRVFQAVIAGYVGEPDKAESELKLAIEECEDPLRAEMQLVAYYRGTGRLAEAVVTCEAACERHPETVEPWLVLSNLYGANAEYKAARNTLRRGLDAVIGASEKRTVSIQLALLELLHGDRTDGIGLLRELAARDGQDVQVRLLLLGAREIREDSAAATALVGELRKIEGESGLWWRFHQAALWLSAGDWRSRQPDITNLLQYCIDVNPQWSAPVLMLAGMHERLRDFRRMEDLYRQALVRNPSAVDITDRLLILLESQGRFTEAEQLVRQTKADPGIASGWQVRTALRAGDTSRAIDELKLRVSNDDRDADSRIQLARLIYQETKDADQAFRYLEAAEAITPNPRAVIWAKVSILGSEGRTQEARQILDDYVADHNDFNAYWTRASHLAMQGETELAEKDFRKLTAFAAEGATGYELLTNFHVHHQRVDQAVAAAEEGANTYPADLRLKRKLMQVLLMRGGPQDRERALEILAVLEQKQPQDPELMKLRAMQALEDPTDQSRAEAREKLEAVVKLEPTAVDGHLLLIGMAMQDGRHENARDLAIRALGANPNHVALLVARGRAELALGNTRMGVELAHMALQQDSNSTQALDVLVEAAAHSGDHNLREGISARIDSVIAQNPGDERLLLWQAQALVALGQTHAAIPRLETYCRTEEGGSSVNAFVTLADLYRLAGDMERAEQSLERAQKVAPDSQIVVHTRFIWLVAQKRFDDLKGISAAYIQAKDPELPNLLRAASMLVSAASPELKSEGIELFQHAAASWPKSVDARLGLASALYQTGNAEAAEKKYREFLHDHPNNPRALNDLAWILQERFHRYGEALELAEKGLRLAPESVHLLDTKGVILMNMPNRLREAKTCFESIVRISSRPASPDPRREARSSLQLGRIAGKLNESSQVRKYLTRALEIDRNANVLTAEDRLEIDRLMQGLDG
jgi:cellulose synthase operon protein C